MRALSAALVLLADPRARRLDARPPGPPPLGCGADPYAVVGTGLGRGERRPCTAGASLGAGDG